LSELKRIFAPHEYTEEQRKNFQKNKNELIKIISMFWYALYLHYFKSEDYRKEKEKVMQFLKKYERNNFSNTIGRREIIHNFFKRNKNTILSPLFKHFKRHHNNSQETLDEKYFYLFGIPTFNIKGKTCGMVWEKVESDPWVRELDSAKSTAIEFIGGAIASIEQSHNEDIYNHNDFHTMTGNIADLSDIEVEMIRYICKIIPDKRKDKNKLLDGYWEIIDIEDRRSLMNYIKNLYTDPQIINRYVMAIKLCELEEKLDRISTMILYPQYNRIVNNLGEIQNFFLNQNCYDIQVDEEILIKCDKYLSNIKEKLISSQKRSRNDSWSGAGAR
jgi:hypothetical protein